MSGLLNSSLNGSTSNLPDSTGRSFPSSFSGLSGAASPGYHHSGSLQGMQNIHGSFSVPNIPGALASRNSTMNGVPSAGVQQAAGGLAGGRFVSNNLTGALSQMSHGSSAGHSGVSGRGGLSLVGSHGYNTSTNGVGGSIPGVLPASATSGNRSAIPGLGVSPMLNNTSQRIASSMGNMVGAGNVGRSISSGGVINIAGHASRLNLSANSGTGSLNIPGSNRLMSGGLQQASPQGISMLGNSYLPQSNFQSMNNMGILGDMNNNDSSPFDINDFPQLTSRPSSAGGHQQQLGSMRKPGLGVGQQNQEFSIQNEDFPALPGGNSDYAMDLHQKDQLHDNAASMMSQHFAAGRSTGFNLGGNYSSHRPQHPSSGSGSGINFSQLNNQDLLHLHGSDMFPSSQSSFHAQSNGLSGIGLRPINSSNTVSGMGSYEHLIQQYQQQHNQSQYRLPQMSGIGQLYRDPGTKQQQASPATPDPFGLLGLLSVVRMSDPGLTSLALGVDLTTLGLNLNSSENLHKTFSSPWSDEPAKGDPEYSVPPCYYAKPPPPLHPNHFSRFQAETLFYIFYSMPKDEMQLYAANELYNRGWFYHREHRLWLTRVPKSESLVKTTTYERGPYLCFDPNTFDTIRKDNFVVHYEMVEKRPALPQH
uniref:NOT2/NOT3/NOT5 C-terminal domain-containing protein n=1 Tax=Kalanchoe fedtschenkoi TaxID=63787 RepID=A0A7N0RAL8_KALFE